MPSHQSTSDPHAVETQLRTALPPLRPDIPSGAICVTLDEQGLLSATVYGVEQSLQPSSPLLQQEVLERFMRYHPIYEPEEIHALLATLKIIAPKAGIAIPPGSLKLTELPAGVLVLTLNDGPVAASEDPLHLFSQAMLHLKTDKEQRR